MSALSISEPVRLTVLLGETKSGKLALIVNLSGVLKARMEELGVDVAELVRRYCQLRADRGETGIVPNNQRRTIVRILNDEGSPTVETLVDLIAALGGEVHIRWRTEREVVRVEIDEREDTLTHP